ncbi:SDR family oxidoreductase [Orrella sp. NBD-18]|uniref:SDR family oxidoreductase n=1 Tax=Sheuella amnicola TaxID=2707330 RepID=A0A6B2QZL9_9BURK|nr:SDR family oxidoreductase [Sheuella amnicola]NDY82609.1 SDR family oxidoreductase [Sheuella amnicola]
MDLHLNGQHVLITGGSKGIGLACAKTFLDEGAKVSLVSRDHATLVLAKKHLMDHCPEADSRIGIYSADLKNAQSAANALDQAERDSGPVDILVNSAGAAKRASVDDLTPEKWREAMDAKFFTYINMIDPVIKRMGARRCGVIVNVIGAGGKSPSVLHVSGGSANAALMLATAGLAAAYAPHGVRVNAVNPGPVFTERLKEGIAVAVKHQNITEEEALKNTTEKIALGRVADPAEIADTVVYLASDRASYVTGTIITMDGAAHPIVV